MADDSGWATWLGGEGGMEEDPGAGEIFERQAPLTK